MEYIRRSNFPILGLLLVGRIRSTEVLTIGVIMNADRRMVAEAVVQGLVSEEHLTLSELNEMIEILSDVSIHQGLEDARLRGCIVFYGSDTETMH